MDATPSTWTIDSSRSKATFLVRNKMFGLFSLPVNGSLGEMRGAITLDEANPANSKVSLTIPAASLTTGMKSRDKHLRSADFFDVDNHPEIIFSSSSIEAVDAAAGKYRVNGDLSARRVSNPVELDVTYSPPRPNAPERRVIITGTTTVMRRMFGMDWTSFQSNPAEEALLSANVEAVPAK